LLTQKSAQFKANDYGYFIKTIQNLELPKQKKFGRECLLIGVNGGKVAFNLRCGVFFNEVATAGGVLKAKYAGKWYRKATTQEREALTWARNAMLKAWEEYDENLATSAYITMRKCVDAMSLDGLTSSERMSKARTGYVPNANVFKGIQEYWSKRRKMGLVKRKRS
jgi:hypothetical protein